MVEKHIQSLADQGARPAGCVRSGLRKASPASQLFAYVAIGVVGLLARIPFYLAFHPIWNNDSSGYAIPYYLWRNHRFFLGARTPVYPLFLGLVQWMAGSKVAHTLPPFAGYATIEHLARLSAHAASIAVGMQSLLDLLALCFLYPLMRRLHVRHSIALVAALFAATIPALGMVEMNILNLSLSFDVLILSVFVFVCLVQRQAAHRPVAGLAIACGVLFAVSALLRPENLVFCTLLMVVMAAAVWWMERRGGARGSANASMPKALLPVGLILLSAAPLLLAWMSWNYVGVGEFRVTTLTGWNRSKTVYNLFDRVDQEDALLGRALTASFHKRNQPGSIVRDHVWQALKDDLWDEAELLPLEDPTLHLSSFHQQVDHDFESVLGMKAVVPCEEPGQLCTELLRREIDIGDYVGRVSWKLAAGNPLGYLANVADNFAETFSFRYLDAAPAAEDSRITAVDGGSHIRNRRLADLLPAAIHLYAPLLSVVYVVMVLGLLWAPLAWYRRQWVVSPEEFVVVSLAIATLGTFLAMCFLSGFNREYSIPHLGIILTCAACAVERAVAQHQKRYRLRCESQRNKASRR